MKKFIIILLLFISIISRAQTTYYVAATGGDNASAGTKTSPWASLAYAVATAKSGDVIYLQAGTHTIATAVNVPTGLNITGAGATSIIHSDVTAAYATTLLLASPVGSNGNQTISYLKFDGGLTAYNAVTIHGRSNVLIHHCDFIDFYNSGIIYNGAAAWTSSPPTIYATGNKFYNNTINNCADYPYAADDGNGALMLGGQSGMEIHDNIINQTTRGTNRNGYLIKFYSFGYNKGLKIYNNTLTRKSDAQPYWYFPFSIEMWHTRGGVEIFNNTMTGGIDVGGTNGDCAVKGDYKFSVWVHDNIIGQPTMMPHAEVGIYLELSTSDVIIERNYFRNLSSGIMISPAKGDKTKNLTIRYNIFNGIGDTKNFDGYGFRYIVGTTGAFVDSVKIHNNVFNAGTDAVGSIAAIGIPGAGTTTNFTIANNIITGFSYVPMYSGGAQGQTIDNLTIKNNLFFKNGNSNAPMFDNITPKNFTNSGNIINDPLFFSSTNFHPKSGSPALKAGAKIDDLLFDLDGIVVGVTPNIGCFETTAELATPAYLSSVIEDSNPAKLIVSYDMPLTQIIPGTSAFDIKVNSQTRNISSVEVIEGKVHITLESPVFFGEVISVSYIVPALKPLQSVTNISASAFDSRIAVNNVKKAGSVPTGGSSLSLSIYPNPVHDSFNIKIDGDIPDAAKIFRISALSGIVVYESAYTPGMFTELIKVKLNPGLYIAQLLSSDAILCASRLIVTN